MASSTSDVDVVDPYSRNLGRGKACASCRRRKLRCGGERPSCNRCVEARTRKLDAMRRKGKTEEEIQAIRFPACYAEDEADEGGGGGGHGNESSGSLLVAADDKQYFPNAVGAAAASTGSTGRSSAGPLTPEDRRPNKVQKKTGMPAFQAPHESKSGEQSATQNDLFFAEILSSHLPMDASSRTPSNDPYAQPTPASGVSGGAPMAFNMAKGNLDQGGRRDVSVTESYWMNDPDIAVPAQPLLGRLIDVFFEEHPVAFIFHPGRLRERLLLDPQDSNYPHASVLHIISALSYAARPDLDEEISGEKPTYLSGLHYRHYLAAKHSVDHTIRADIRVNMFDIVRTALMFVFKLYGQGEQLESYLASAQAARLCVSLNMNRDVPSRAEQQIQQLQYLLMQPRITDASIIRPEPSDDIEAEELRRTMSLMFCVDRTSIVATLWPGALTEEDYTAELPRATLDEFLSTTTENVSSQLWTQRRSGLTLQSTDFFSRRAADAEQFFVKSTILLGRCAQYVTRLSRTATTNQIVSAPRFQQLESWIATLHLESYEMANLAAKSPAGPKANGASPPNGGGGGMFAPRRGEGSLAKYLLNSGHSDAMRKGALITSSITPYACTLTLHEPLAGLSSESEARCQAATRGAIGILRLCAVHAEEEMQRLDVIMTIVVMLVGRSLIRQFESLYSKYIAQEMTQQGNPSSNPTPGMDGSALGESVWSSDEFNESVSLLQADLEVVLLTLKRFGEKWLVALKMHDSLLKLLQFNPEHRLRGLFCVE